MRPEACWKTLSKSNNVHIKQTLGVEFLGKKQDYALKML